jgi:hypothetical protein
MYNQIYYAWDVTDRIKLCYNLNLVAQHRMSFQKVVFDTLTNEIVKNYTRNILNIR